MHEAQTASFLRLDEALEADHERIETRLWRLLGKLRGRDRDGARTCWEALEADLETHLRAEEELIVAAFEHHSPHEAARIRSEHAAIRQLLEQLGVELDLHELTDGTVARFAGMLAAHAAHEESVLYAWAQSHLPERARRSALGRLDRRLSRARRERDGVLPGRE